MRRGNHSDTVREAKTAQHSKVDKRFAIAAGVTLSIVTIGTLLDIYLENNKGNKSNGPEVLNYSLQSNDENNLKVGRHPYDDDTLCLICNVWFDGAVKINDIVWEQVKKMYTSN